MTMKKWSALLLAVVLCMSMALTGCGGEATYKVTVKDALGNAYSSGIVVEFLQDGTKVAMQPCDDNGVASKKLAKGDYTVALSFTDGEENYYYESDLSVSAKKRELDVNLAKRVVGEPEALFAQGNEFDAYAVSDGCTYVELDTENRNYYLFTPQTAGTYEFSIADDADAEIGYYGAPHYVQAQSATEVKDNAFTISVSATMIGSGDGGTSIFVIGVDAKGDSKSCVLGIQRIGDPQWSVEDEPWTIYEGTHVPEETYVLPEDATIQEFDLTASTDTYKLVYNEEEGYYHLDSADGPLVLVRLAEDCEYIACFQTILDRSGVSRYFFDEDGNFEKKVSYSECLLEYIDYADEAEGVYPLTEDLKHIIQQRGEYVGWWDIDGNGYLFKDLDGNNIPDINAEIAWLLMCCYIE